MTGVLTCALPIWPGALGLKQAHVFIEADGPGREIELLGKIADGVGSRHGWRVRQHPQPAAMGMRR